MKKAAFAAVAVLSVSVIWAANQQPPVPQQASFPPVSQPSYNPGEEAVLQSKLRKLVEVKAKTMSAEELRLAIQAMERLGVEAELAPIIDQLRQIEQEHAGKRAGRKAQLAIWVLRTQDDPLLGELTNLAWGYALNSQCAGNRNSAPCRMPVKVASSSARSNSPSRR